ncbi:hypothetical protein [Sphingosinicella sp. CPCC 101087]|uniref:hypothetical protein n=1 Tax=Sphingosinicella sp. CPCC 101087 TaxID=2497754 RepID=UPI00101C8AE0|nr:hypothetical protein [Sphingosinicella sp. CPCC 101087]
MILAGTTVLLLALIGAGGQTAPPSPRAEDVRIRHQQIIIRVTRERRTAAAGGAPTNWRERRGPRCLTARQVTGATSLRPNSVDLILRDNSRVRAVLQRRCPALDYYRGFYINATQDGRICADRDSIRSRAGGECQIDDFKALTPEQP